MRLFLTSFLAILLTLSVALADGDGQDQNTGNTDNKEIHWMKYDEGLAAARESGKHVFANFTTSWCGYCKKMNRTTFVDPEIVAALNENFIAVKIDGDSRDTLDIDGYKITEKLLTKAEYRVGGYPTYWFLDSDGTKLGYLRGYQSSAQLSQALTFVSERQYEKQDEDQGTDQQADGSRQ